MSEERAMRVLVVDDSAIYRRILGRVLEAEEGVEFVGVAPDGVEAVEQVARLRPDLVLLDLVMPRRDGLTTLEILGREHPDTAVLMVSAVSDAAKTIRALHLGAIDFVPKPEGGDAESLRRHLQRGIEAVRQRRRDRSRGAAVPPAQAPTALPAPVVRPAPERRFTGSDLVVVGVSTGGPSALESLLPPLPADLASPVLLVQHMPRGFTASLADCLDRRSPLAVSEARDGDAVLPGRVLIAPGGMHMVLAPREGGDAAPRVRVLEGAPRNQCRPSVDVLFESVAEHFGGPVLALVLTGMGSDGCEGVRALKRRGHTHCLAQDEATSVVYGMPRVVAEAGLADEVLPLEALSGRTLELAGAGRLAS